MISYIKYKGNKTNLDILKIKKSEMEIIKILVKNSVKCFEIDFFWAYKDLD